MLWYGGVDDVVGNSNTMSHAASDGKRAELAATYMSLILGTR